MPWETTLMQSLPSVAHSQARNTDKQENSTMGTGLWKQNSIHSPGWGTENPSQEALGPPHPTVLGLGPYTAFKLYPCFPTSERRTENCIEHSSERAQGRAAELRHVNSLPPNIWALNCKTLKALWYHISIFREPHRKLSLKSLGVNIEHQKPGVREWMGPRVWVIAQVLAVWRWASHLMFLCFHFHSVKWGQT